MIRSLDEMVEQVLLLKRLHRVAIAWAHDGNTASAITRAAIAGMVVPVMIGNPVIIKKTFASSGFNEQDLNIIEADDEVAASERAVSMAANGEVDIVMKGLAGTDKFLRAVMNRDHGIMNHGAVLTYICAMELPAYHKLLFITDPAVIPFPDLDQKLAMVRYALQMTERFGIVKPKIALIGPAEKVSRHFPSSADYAVMCKMADRNQLGNCIMDGPLDIFLACDRNSVAVKKVPTPVNGEADILLFPSLEACNPFYKGLTLFARGEIAGILQGTIKPVVMMSRSESEKSKFYCLALACLMA